MEPETLRQSLTEFIEKSSLEKIVPTPKEAGNSAALALWIYSQ